MKLSIFSKIHSLLKKRPPTSIFRLGIDGVSGSGKTVFASDLKDFLTGKKLPIIQASIDGFHNPRSVRTKRGPDCPVGYYHDSFNYSAIQQHLLIPLSPGGNQRYRTEIFDFVTDSTVAQAEKQAAVGSILIMEGVLMQRPEIRDFFDMFIFLKVDFETILERVSTRDQHLFGQAEDVRQRYETRYIPGQKIYFEAVKPERKADIVIDNNDFERPTVLKWL